MANPSTIDNRIIIAVGKITIMKRILQSKTTTIKDSLQLIEFSISENKSNFFGF